MAKLTSLKPRVASCAVRPLALVDSDSWRTGKTTGQRGYNYRWQKARERFLQQHPLCVHCEHANRVTAATDVDHIVPHRGDQALFWLESNWQALCHSCHSIKTAAEEAGDLTLEGAPTGGVSRD